MIGVAIGMPRLDGDHLDNYYLLDGNSTQLERLVSSSHSFRAPSNYGIIPLTSPEISDHSNSFGIISISSAWLEFYGFELNGRFTNIFSI